MASKVNLRFTAILIVIITVVFGATAVVAVVAMKNTGEELMARGDELMAEGDIEEAIKAYSRAVNKQQMNADWIRTWIAAMEQYVPESRQEYVQYYSREYMGGLAGLARADTTGVESRMRFLEEIYQRHRRLGASQGDWEFLVAEAQDQMRAADETEGAEQLRRYRGLARQAMLDRGIQLPEEDVEKTREDLETALEIKPDDSDVAVALANWHAVMASRARLANLPEEAAQESEAAAEAISSFVEANPDDLWARLAQLSLEMDEFRQTAGGTITAEEFQNRFGPRVDALETEVLATAPETLDDIVVRQLALHLRLTGREDRVPPLLEHALSGQPDNAGLRLTLAERLTPSDPGRAIEEFDKIVAQPDKPVGIDGLALLHLREAAREMKIMAALTQWELAENAEGRSEALARAKTFRDELAAAVGASSQQVLLADARLHFAQGELLRARKELNDYLKLNPDHIDARVLLANVMQRQGSLGAARDMLAELVTDRRNASVTVLARLVQISAQLGEYDEAVRYAQVLADAEPGNEQYQSILREYQDLLAGGGDDPIKTGLLEARQMLSGVTPDQEGALALLRRLVEEHPDDPRTHVYLIETLTIIGEKEEATLAAQKAVAAIPDNAALQRYLDALSVEDPVQAVLERIDESDQSPVEKELAKWRLMARFGDADRAEQALAEAERLDPTHPAVVETLFVRALEQDDLDKAQGQAAIAEKNNLDNVKGQTYRARILMIKGEYKEAASMLERALATDPLNPGAHRWLGELRLVLGQPAAAIESLERSLEFRPGDIAALKALLKAHNMAGRPEQALQLAREAQERAANDPEFVELWLTLETTAAGGDRQEALRIRRSLAERFPQNDRNLAQLTRLLMDEGQWDEAKTVIDSLRERDDSLAHLDLHLRWLARQNRLQDAVDTLNAYVEANKEKVAGGKNYLIMAEILTDIGRVDLALETLRQGREYQEPGMPRCDLARAGLLFKLGRFEDALSVFRAAAETLDPANDPDRMVPKRIAECLIKTGAHEEALASMDEAQLDMRSDPTVLLLAAEAHASLGHDRNVVMDLLNKAIAVRPDVAIGYIQRAAYNARTEGMGDDVEADLIQALNVQPNSSIARQRLAEHYIREERWVDAIDLYVRAVNQDAGNEDLRMDASRLLVSRERVDEAVRLLEAGLQLNPESTRLRMEAGRLCGMAARHADARRHYQTLWEQTKAPTAAAILVDALLAGSSPEPDRAARVLASPELKVDSDAVLLACRARLKLAQKRPPQEAMADLAAAVRALDSANPQAVADFLTALSRFHKNEAETLATLSRIQPESGYKLWMALQVAMMLARQPEMADVAVQELTRLSGTEAAPALRLAALRALGNFRYQRNEHQQALEAFMAALEIAPEDGELLNNVAYILSAHLGDPQRALEYAEKAAQARPTDPNVLDTLGVTYMRLNQLDRALEALNRAVACTTENPQRVAAYIHLAELHLERDQRGEAQRYLDLLGQLEGVNPALLAPHAESLQALRDRLSKN